MGVSISSECGDFSYSGFGVWRAAVAKAAGRPTRVHDDLGERHVVEAGVYHPRVFMGWWDDDPADALDVLLVHSDCEGYIFPKHAEPLADRLCDLIPLIDGTTHKDVAANFAKGLRKAADEWTVVQFS